VEAFLQGLRDLGYVEGRTIAIEYRWAEGKTERIPELAQELVRLEVDVIVTSNVSQVVKRVTTTIPFVRAGDFCPAEAQ
jgi:putative ABC transport system substrate-binding protein